MDPVTITAIAGVSGALGMLGLIAYFYTILRIKELEADAQRSIRKIVQGQGIFDANQVVEILRTFGSDEGRLAALKELAKLQRAAEKSAVILYEQIKTGMGLLVFSERRFEQAKTYTARTTIVFLAIALLIAVYGIVTNPAFRALILGLFHLNAEVTATDLPSSICDTVIYGSKKRSLWLRL